MARRGSERILLGAASGAALGALGLSLWIASREWFTRDDFAFLAFVQQPETWSWAAVYLPLGERFWPFYRPLGMETFFWVGFRLFGLDAFGFFTTSVVLHFATGVLVFRIARRFGFDASVALATAVLAVTRPPSLLEIYWGSVFMYVGAVAFGLLAVERFLAWWQNGGAGAHAASWLALVLALLCNEIAVTLPAALALASLAAGAGARDLSRLARGLAPHALATAAYAGIRFGILAPDPPSELYRPALGAHVLPNALALWLDLFGASAAAAAAAGVAMAALGAVAAGQARFPGAAGWVARVVGACVAWVVLVTLPFALLPFPQPRWAMNLEAPACLAFGALLEAARRSLPARRLDAFQGLLAVGLLAAVPWSALALRGRSPLGAQPQRLALAIDSARPALSDAAQIILLFGAPGLADAADGERMRSLAYGGGVLNAVDPRTRRVLRFLDLSRRPGRNAVRPDGDYFVLRPDLRVERADPTTLARELPRGIERGP